MRDEPSTVRKRQQSLFAGANQNPRQKLIPRTIAGSFAYKARGSYKRASRYQLLAVVLTLFPAC